MSSFFNLRRFLRNKRGLGAPVGNLIILVAAVVLSTTVVLYAVTVTSNQVQKENLYVAGATLDSKQANVTIVNTGPTSIRVTQITVKGEKFSNYTTVPEEVKNTGLQRGNETTITVELPEDLITQNDIGRPTTIVVATTQNSYFTETLVQASTETAPTPPP